MKLWSLLGSLFLVLALLSSTNATKGPLKELLGLELEGFGKWKIWEGFKLKKLGKLLTFNNLLKPGLGWLGVAEEAVSPSENIFLIEDPKTGVRVMAIDNYENPEIYETQNNDDTTFKIQYPIHNLQYQNQYPAPHPIYYTDESVLHDPYEVEGRQESQITLTKADDDDAVPSLPLEKKIKEFLNEHAKHITEQYNGKTKTDYINDYYQDDYDKSESPQLYWYTFDDIQKMTPIKIGYDEHGSTKLERLDSFTLPNKNYEIKKDELISTNPDLSFYVVQPITNPQVIEKEGTDFTVQNEFLLITQDLDQSELENRDFTKRSPYQYSPMPLPYYGYEGIVGAETPNAPEPFSQQYKGYRAMTEEAPKTQAFGYEGIVGTEAQQTPEQSFYQYQGYRAADGEAPQTPEPKSPEGPQVPQVPQNYQGYRAMADDTPKAPLYGFEGIVGSENPTAPVQGYYGIDDTQQKSTYFGYEGIVGAETPAQTFQQFQGYRAADGEGQQQNPAPEPEGAKTPQQYQGYRAMTEEAPVNQFYGYQGYVAAETPNENSAFGVTGPQAGDEVGTFYKGNPLAVNKYNSGYGSYYDKLGHQDEGGNHYKIMKYYSNYNINYGGYGGGYGHGGGHGGYGHSEHGGYGHGGHGGYGHGGYEHGGYGGGYNRYYRSPEEYEELTTQQYDEMISLAATSTGIPNNFNTESTKTTDDLIVSESKFYPFAVFNRCQRSCPSIKEKKIPTAEGTQSTTCSADGILSNLKSIFKPRLQIRQTPDDDPIVGYALTDRMKQPFFGLLSPSHSITNHQAHSYPHNQHSPEYYQQQQTDGGPTVYNHPMPQRYPRHCNPITNKILSTENFLHKKFPQNPLFNKQDIKSSVGQITRPIFNLPFIQPKTRFFKKYTNVEVKPPIIGTVDKAKTLSSKVNNVEIENYI